VKQFEMRTMTSVEIKVKIRPTDSILVPVSLKKIIALKNIDKVQQNGSFKKKSINCFLGS
jgi:hypothetical protein